MKILLCTAMAVMALANTVWAHDHPAHTHAASGHSHTEAPAPAANNPKLDAHTQEDMERHRGMARAHESAAQCLAEGKPYASCQKQLQADCKGLALGKNCGMRHAH